MVWSMKRKLLKMLVPCGLALGLCGSGLVWLDGALAQAYTACPTANPPSGQGYNCSATVCQGRNTCVNDKYGGCDTYIYHPHLQCEKPFLGYSSCGNNGTDPICQQHIYNIGPCPGSGAPITSTSCSVKICAL